jgi:hypothetical protein
MKIHLIEPDPEDNPTRVDNAFDGIKSVPAWRYWMDVLVASAAILSILDISIRFLSG